MKKFIALSVMALVCVAFAGCGEKTNEEKAKDAVQNAADKTKDAIDGMNK